MLYPPPCLSTIPESGFYKMEGFYRKASRAREPLTKEKRIILGGGLLFLRWGEGKGFLSSRLPLRFRGVERAPVTDASLVVTGKSHTG